MLNMEKKERSFDFMKVIYAVHKKNKKKVFEVWYDFMPHKKVVLFNYTIVHIRYCVKLESQSFQKAYNKAKEEGKIAFNRRYNVTAYNSYSGFLKDEAAILGENSKHYKIIAKKSQPYFQKINPQNTLF